MESWLEIPLESDFSLYNIPFGIYKQGRGSGRLASRVGDFIVDLSQMQEARFFDALPIDDPSVFYEEVLNPFIGLGKTATNAVRGKIIEIFQKENGLLRDQPELRDIILKPSSKVQMLMPVKVGDYTDFYSSEYHARNVGAMFRGADNALLPNWKHMPIAYHGKASSIYISGTPVLRPKGQYKLPDSDNPVFGHTKKLDFELELAFITGKATQQGENIPVEKAGEYIFGFVLFNDWSSRDIQAWEYAPLGPFLSKNFASTISPWVVTLEALMPFVIPGPVQEPPVLDYLKLNGESNFDIDLEVKLQTEGGMEATLCKTNSKFLYWNVYQQLAHHTVNGCNINVGDMYASGTISGPLPGSYGSLLEITLNGKELFGLPDGNKREFLEDGDSVIFSGTAGESGKKVGFGMLVNKVSTKG
ncbi:MAG: fumarylacetoacetase [Bacteroidota bacterium]|nr:fumarylacetoacetase [Bacteroidota bacterium]